MTPLREISELPLHAATSHGNSGAKIHPLALCESEHLGTGTRLWANVHVMAGAVIGCDCNLGDGTFVESGACVGDRVTIKNQVMIWDGVTLKDDVFVGPGVIFTNDASPRSPRMPQVKLRYESPERWRCETTVHQGASIGAGAIILPGIEIGAYAMIGAGSIVTRDVAAHQVVVGNPARAIGWVCKCGVRLDDSQHCSQCRVDYKFPRLTTLRKAS